MTYDILQSSTQSALLFLMVQSSDHITALTGASPTVTISKNGASFASPSGAVTEIGSGWYKVAGNATDTATLGPLALHATAASGDPTDMVVANIVSYNPQSATNLGLSALPTANPGAANGVFIAGTNAATTITTGLTTTFTGNLTGSVASVTGAVGSVTGLTASNLDTTVSSRMATYTQPTGFLAATFPTGTVANTTNITAGTITTTTNLTNAPTAGDFTATMKTSLNNSTPASITGTVGSVTGNVGGNVTGSVGSVVAAVAITSNRKKGATATFEFLMQDSTTGVPKTGLTVASTISKDGGVPVNTANAVTEIGLGQYQIVLTGTEMTMNNGFLQFTATGAITYNLSIQTQP